MSPHLLVTVEETRLLDPMAGKKSEEQDDSDDDLISHSSLGESFKVGAAAGRVESQKGAQCSLRQDKSDFAAI